MNTHIHDWDQLDPTTYHCTTCAETAPACTQTKGRRPCGNLIDTSLTICDPCLRNAKRIIQDIIDAIDTVPFHQAEIMGLRSPRYDRDIVHGGDDRDRLPFGLDAVVEDPEDPRIAAAKHPNTALEILHGWAHAWADTRGDIITSYELDYLIEHTLWAAQNPDDSGWDTYLTEARAVRRTIRRLLGLHPVTEPAPCVHCGGTIIRDWLPDGLDDIRRCTKCGTTWPDETRLRNLNHLTVLALHATHPNELVTVDDARLALPDLKRNTINQALKRDRDRTNPDHPDYQPDYQPRIPAQGTDTRGRTLYRLADFTALTNGAA